MPSYVHSTILPNEMIIYQAKLHWIIFLFPSLLAIALIQATYGASLLFIAFPLLQWHGTELAVTDRRIIAKWGIVRRSTVELRLDRAEGLTVQQGLLGRMLSYGTVIVSGTGTTKAPIPGIADPIAFRRAVYETQERWRPTHAGAPAGSNGPGAGLRPGG